MRHRIAFGAIVAVSVIMGPLAAAAPQTVDGLGDPARVRVEGAKVISVEQVRRALRDSAEFQLASTPSAPLDELLKVVPVELTRAYHRGGFPHAKVQAAFDEGAGAIVITVVEGPRHTADEIVVAGAKRLDAKRIAEAPLTPRMTAFPVQTSFDHTIRVETWGKAKDPPKPLWNKGKPAPFDLMAIKSLESHFAAEMSRQGFFRPRFTVSQHTVDGSTRLVVGIEDEGPRATVAQIQITGANRNKPADVRRYLGLSEGMAIDADVLQSIAKRLWDSGRFWKHPITLAPLPDGSGQVRLTIDLDEHPTASLLGEKLTLDEQAMLRMRDWLDQAANGRRDVIVRMHPVDHPEAFEIKFIIGSSRGVAAHLRPGKPEALSKLPPEDAANFGRHLGFALTSRQMGFYDVTGQAKYVAGVDLARTDIVAEMSYAPDLSPTAQTKRSFEVSAGVRSKGRGMTFNVVLAPVCFVALVHDVDGGGAPRLKADAQDGVFSFSIGAVVFRFRQDTGEVVDARAVNKEAGAVWGFTFEEGALEREVAGLEAAVKTPNLADFARPSTAVLPVLAVAAGHLAGGVSGVSAERREAGARALARLARGPLVDWVDGLVGKDDAGGGDGDDEFEIPLDSQKVQAGGMLSFLVVAVPWCDHFFPRGSWPWTLARESIMVVSGWGKHSRAEAGRMYRSEEVGPLGFLAMAYAYSQLDAQSARIFAKRGLERMTLEYFAKDCDALLGPARGRPNAVTAAVSSLGRLGDEDLEAIAGLLPAKAAAIFKLLARHQREVRGDSPALVPAGLQRQLWEAGLREAVHGALTHFSRLE